MFIYCSLPFKVMFIYCSLPFKPNLGVKYKKYNKNLLKYVVEEIALPLKF